MVLIARSCRQACRHVHAQVVCGLSIGWTADGTDPRLKPGFFPKRIAVEGTTSWAVDDGY